MLSGTEAILKGQNLLHFASPELHQKL